MTIRFSSKDTPNCSRTKDKSQTMFNECFFRKKTFIENGFMFLSFVFFFDCDFLKLADLDLYEDIDTGDG